VFFPQVASVQALAWGGLSEPLQPFGLWGGKLSQKVLGFGSCFYENLPRGLKRDRKQKPFRQTKTAPTLSKIRPIENSSVSPLQQLTPRISGKPATITKTMAGGCSSEHFQLNCPRMTLKSRNVQRVYLDIEDFGGRTRGRIGLEPLKFDGRPQDREKLQRSMHRARKDQKARNGNPSSYKGSIFHRVIQSLHDPGGGLHSLSNGNGGESTTARN